MSRKSKLNIIYYVAAGICGATLGYTGIGLSDWQWWVTMLCMWVGYVVGREIND